MPKKIETSKVVHTPRPVIEKRLLDTLETNKSVVAIIATKQNLDLFITAMEHWSMMLPPESEEFREARGWVVDLRTLRQGAF